MSRRVIITEDQLRRICRVITEDYSANRYPVFGEYMKYIEEIGQHGQLPPKQVEVDNDFLYLIGASCFFSGYTEEGEFDEYEFEMFLDEFFKKYGEGVLADNVSVDDVYETFLPADLEKNLTPMGLKCYEHELIVKGKEVYEGFQGYLKFNQQGQIYCARAVQLGSDMTANDFLEEYGGEIGIYWSFTDSGARTYYSEVAGPVVVFRGWVNPCDVEWDQTIQTQSADEQELRLKYGATVQVDQIIDEYTEYNLLQNGSILLTA